MTSANNGQPGRRRSRRAGAVQSCSPVTAGEPDTLSLSAELGAERLAFLRAECEREYLRSLPDTLRHVIDLRMCARFRADQRRAMARVRSLLRRETRRLAHRNAGAGARPAVRRAIAQIEGGNDDMLKLGLHLLRALDARDSATIQRLTTWHAPRPRARRCAS